MKNINNNKKVYFLLSNPCLKDPRVEFEAGAVSKLGYQSIILCWDRSGNLPEIENKDNYTIKRVFVKSRYSLGLRQIFKFIIFYYKAYKILKEDSSCHIIHCNDLDTLPVGVILKKKKNIKLVYDAHEIYSEMTFRNILLRAISEKIEKKYLDKVDLFFTVGEVRRKWYLNKRYKVKPIVLGNWKEKKNLKINVENEKNKQGINNQIIILYIGVLNSDRNLIDILKTCSEDRRFQLIIGGEGTQSSIVKEYSDKFQNIKYQGFINDEKELIYYNLISDVIYYGMNKKSLTYKTAVPNKMFEAIAYDKLFLCSMTGEMLEIDKEKSHFIFINDLKDNLEEIYKIVNNNKIREKITNKNDKLYSMYNKVKAEKVLIENYTKLER